MLPVFIATIEKIADFEVQEKLSLWRRVSRTIANTRAKGIKRHLKPELVYYTVQYSCSQSDYRPTSVSSTTSEVELDVSSDHLESDADRGRWTDVSLLDLDIDVADLEMPPVIAMRDAEVMARSEEHTSELQSR